MKSSYYLAVQRPHLYNGVPGCRHLADVCAVRGLAEAWSVVVDVADGDVDSGVSAEGSLPHVSGQHSQQVLLRHLVVHKFRHHQPVCACDDIRPF